MKPTVLIAVTSPWFEGSRLAMVLASAGFTVAAVCPPGHPLGKARALRETHTYYPLTPLLSLAHAISATRPDIVVPTDDLAVQRLHQLYYWKRNGRRAKQWICALIERSVGAPESFPLVCARIRFVDLAKELGIRVPQTKVIANTSNLEKWLVRMGYPTVLKVNRTAGGPGVRIVRTLNEAELAFQKLQAPPPLVQALGSRDRTLIWPSLLRRRSVVNAQAFVAGRKATSAIACWQGTVLAVLHFEVVSKPHSTGPASELHLIQNAEMSSAAKKMVSRLNLSGLYGFDFMLETHSGNAYLIEINSRTTEVAHLTLGPGRDLPTALYAAVSGEAVQAALKFTESDRIALFPQDRRKDPREFHAEGHPDFQRNGSWIDLKKCE